MDVVHTRITQAISASRWLICLIVSLFCCLVLSFSLAFLLSVFQMVRIKTKLIEHSDKL